MDDGYWPYSIGVFILFIVLEAVFYGFGSAVQNLNTGNLEREAEEGNKKAAKLLKIAGRPTRFINSIRIVSNAIGMFIGAYLLGKWSVRLETAVPFFNREAGGRIHIAAFLAVGILALVALISFGIVIPKRCAAKSPEKWGYALLPFVSAVIVPLLPFIWAVVGLSTVVLKLLGVDISAGEENVTQEEIMSMVNEGHEQGVLEANEAEMINNIFEFGDKEAQDIMTHRINIVGVDGRQNLHTALGFMLNATNSRFPVYEENIDNITGIIHLKDAMRCHTEGKYEEWLIKDIPGLIRPAVFIPETRKINLLFKSMQSKKLQMVMVADEYGQTAGLVALEDILEEIVGNIQDEYDEDEVHIEEQPDGSFLVDGMTPLEELEDRLSIEFNLEEDIGTLNGYLVSKLDKIPSEDENSVIRDLGYSFQILSVAHKKIQKVRIAKLPEEMTEQYNIEKE